MVVRGGNASIMLLLDFKLARMEFVDKCALAMRDVSLVRHCGEP